MKIIFLRTITVIALLAYAAILPAWTQQIQQSQNLETPDMTLPAEKPIAVQMYTLRSMSTLEDQLQAVQAAGVTAVELVGTHEVSAEELKSLLKQYSITPISAHVPFSDIRDESDFDRVIAFNKSVGNHTLVIPWLMPETPTEASGWIAQGKQLGQLADRAATRGMMLAYHNHHFELVDFAGKTGLELLFEAAGPALKAEIDVAWVARAGYDPAAFLEKFHGRVFAIHAKDNAPEGENLDAMGMADVGYGVLDWNAILPAAAAAGVQWYIIEHDQPRDPPASIKASADYLRQHLP